MLTARAHRPDITESAVGKAVSRAIGLAAGETMWHNEGRRMEANTERPRGEMTHRFNSATQWDFARSAGGSEWPSVVMPPSSANEPARASSAPFAHRNAARQAFS